MRKVTTYQLIDGIKRNLLMIFLPAILLFALIFGLGLRKISGTYNAAAILISSVKEGEEVSYNKLVLNEKLANIYLEILKSPDLYKDVEENLNKAGAKVTYKDLMKNTDFEVNPQAGLVAVTYKDTNKDRAKDALSLICEKFRLMAKDFLGADNISYLHKVMVEKSSKLKLMIFSILGGIAGGLLGLILVIIKTLITNKVASTDDLRNMGVDVLASDGEFLKIKSKLTNRLDEGIIGITSLGKLDSFDFSQAFAKTMATNNGILFVDSKNKAGIDNKYLSSAESFKVIRKENMDYIALSEKNSSQILDSNEFFAELANRESSYNYIIIDEKNLDQEDSYLTARLCDMKIILTDSTSKKSDLSQAISDLREAGIDYCGVVYHK